MTTVSSVKPGGDRLASEGGRECIELGRQHAVSTITTGTNRSIYLPIYLPIPTLPHRSTMSITPPKAQYIQLGISGLRISNPILGAMSFGDTRWLPWCLEEAEALPIIKAAFDSGINTWDTANNYSNGRSDEILATAMATYNIPREKVVILSKCFHYWGGKSRCGACRLKA